MACREIPCNEWATWSKKYNAACSAMENRDQKLMEAGAEVEKNLRVCGASAIEDKLQVGVGKCIKELHGADIKLWILTGDKMETAINIGRSTEVLQPEMRVIPFDFPELSFVHILQILPSRLPEFVGLVQAVPDLGRRMQ